MNWRDVRLIFDREIRDQLRDRRTLFMLAVLPLLLYPAIGVGMVQMLALLAEQPKTVVILNADDLPEPPLLDGDGFVADWGDPLTRGRLTVVTDATLAAAEDPEEQRRQAELREAALAVCDEHERVKDIEARLETEDVGTDSGPLGQQLAVARERRAAAFAGSGVDVILRVPPGFADRVAAVDDFLDPEGEVTRSAFELDVADKPELLHNKTDERSLLAFVGVRAIVETWEAALLSRRLAAAGLPASLPKPIDAEAVDLARDKEKSASNWGRMLPALLVLMVVTGAFHPAVDMAAGEKERGTMETLLICPAGRTELVLGKFFAVACFAVGTATLNLLSMAFTGSHMASVMAGAAGAKAAAALQAPGPEAIAWVAVLMLPLAVLFSALCLSLATFAKSTKEGQYYLFPVMIGTIGLTVYCVMPGVEIRPLFSILPVIGPALLLKAALSADAAAWLFVVPVLASSVGYAALALWWCVEQFSREDVLFREAERFEFGPWLRHVLRDKQDLPSFAQAGFCFVLIMILQFFMMSYLRDGLVGYSADELPAQMIKLLIVQQLTVIAFPAVLMGLFLSRRPGKTFRIGLPAPRFLLAGVVLPFTVMPLAYTLVHKLKWFLGDVPPALAEQMAAMTSGEISLAWSLLGFAVAPAVCEEVAFRGFVLSGFGRGGRTWLAIGLSALTFGLMHMIPQQVFNATLLGLLLGWLAVASNSLWPGVVFHLLFNGTQVLLGRLSEEQIGASVPAWLLAVEADGLIFGPVLLGVCAVVSIIILRYVSAPPSAAFAPVGSLNPDTADAT
ncbi:MAG: ABC transporter permease subunit/CPBP intramembrane protease [Planctomycetota bacterium]